ncbi:MAG: hypothetical protein Ct9H300mP32_7010 [Verrucomicrobiota bacterium]|nr:MAG: hypothetical protein Ct9H300mP32_7010 [Verrucomicrobiota bacterium]
MSTAVDASAVIRTSTRTHEHQVWAKTSVRLDRFELCGPGLAHPGWASGKSPTCDLRPAPGRTTGPQPVLRRDLSTICPFGWLRFNSPPFRPVESLRAAWSEKTQRGLQLMSVLPRPEFRPAWARTLSPLRSNSTWDERSNRSAVPASRRPWPCCSLQLVPGCVRCPDTGAIQVGHKAVIKIHLQHERLRHRQFLQLELVS